MNLIFCDFLIKGLENLLRIFHFLVLSRQWGKKTSGIACMAGRPYLVYLCQNSIIIAIDGKGFYVLIMTASLSLNPQLISASAVVGHSS